MNANPNYHKIGLFVFIATLLLIAMVMVLGANTLFKQELILETYVDESVQGLEVGSPVKIRGVRMGKVIAIDQAANIYPDEIGPKNPGANYIIIRMAIPYGKFGDKPLFEIQRELIQDVERGLRLQLVSQGITGLVFLEMNYFEGSETLPVTWSPEYDYVPSAPSLFNSLTDSMDDILMKAQAIDTDGISSETVGLLRELRQTNASFQAVLAEIHEQQIVENVGDTVASVKNMSKRLEADSQQLLANIESIAEELNTTVKSLHARLNDPRVDSALTDISAAMSDLRKTAKDLPSAVSQARATLDGADQTVSEQRQNLDRILTNLAEAVGNLREVSNELRRNPSRFFYSESPAPVELP